MELLNFCQITIVPLDETTKDLNNCMLSRGNKSWSRKKKVRGNKIKVEGQKSKTHYYPSVILAFKLASFIVLPIQTLDFNNF